MKNSHGQTLYRIISFDNSDDNFTGHPSPLACNLPRAIAIKMLRTYREIKHTDGQFRYVMYQQ